MAETISLTKSVGGDYEIVVSGTYNYTKQFPAFTYTVTVDGVRLIARAKGDILMFNDYEPSEWTISGITGFTTIKDVTDAITVLQGSLLKLNYFVRPAGTTYGTGDGTSYSNAYSGFAAIDWTKVNAGKTLYVCGTHAEQLTVGATGTSVSRLKILGDYQVDPAIINIEGTLIDSCILIDTKNYITVKGFSSLIGSGKVSCFRAQGTAGSANIGHTIICEDVNVTRNYATTSGDGFSLGDSAQVEFRNISATKCREEGAGSGSHQCVTTHVDSSAKIFGATFSDCNYWFVNTLNSKIEAHNITASGARVSGIEQGTNVTSSAYVKVYNSDLTFDVAARSFATPSGADISTVILIQDSVINVNSVSASSNYSELKLLRNTINLNTAFDINQNRGKLHLSGNTINCINSTSTSSMITVAQSGYIVTESNTINVTNYGYLMRFTGASSPNRSMIYNNVIINPRNSYTPIRVLDNCSAPIVTNNTVYNSTSAGGDFIWSSHNGDEAEALRLVLKNNIFQNVPVVLVVGSSLVVESNNCFYNSQNLAGTGDIATNPLFVNAGTDFHLQGTSPCIGTGVDLSSYYTTDKDGAARETWDMGAYAA